MNEIVVPDREALASRLREVLSRTPPRARGPFDELEIRHLVEVACNHALLMADIFRDDRVGRVLRAGAMGGQPMLPAEAAGHHAGLTEEAIRQIRRVPDDIKMVGDKCLYDVGLFGKESHDGLDLTQLGRRSYQLASEVLERLADDRRLREFFKQNLLWNLPIEEEVVFLRQCSTRFNHHAELLRGLRLLDGEAQESGPYVNRRTQPTEDSHVEFRSVPGSRNHSLTPPAGGPAGPPPAPTSDASSAEGLTPRRHTDGGGFGGGMMEERPEFLPEELEPVAGVADMDRLPRKDLLSLYERMLLFSGLDIEDLREELKRVVIDQQQAVDSLCDELSLYATGTQSLSRPASYFFVGPTGVGKNHLVESLVRALEKRWDFQIPMLQLEGPQYTYPSDINELKGAARGFIRSDEEGILTEFYSRSSQSPYSVILVDEVEKSHPQLRKFFLSLMDRGTTMDNRGQTLNFVNSMIVYTSNIGYSRLQTAANPIGFQGEADQQNQKDQEVMKDLKKTLSPEFVNRLTIIRFGTLSRASIESIFDLEFERIAARYATMHGLELTVTPRARKELLRRGYNPEFGARPMARLLNVVCNIEVSKKLKRDEIRSPRADRTLREYIREVKEGKRAYDPLSVQRRVMSTARIQVPYKGIAVDYDGGEFLYLPQGRERGSH
ncbi:MAG TPA: AAA family ATPase [Candidatus Polarisedimenticolia bacterium]|nr:AAA family ATPase [Candidatus Polarisedimenticolia bacterium]